MRKKILICFLLCLLFMITACSSQLDTSTISDYASDQIVISGLTDSDFTVTVGDLSALEMVERSASATRANGQKVHIDADGPLLDTFLNAYGKSQADFSSIRFTATDDYSIAVSQDVLAKRDILLALGDGGKALTAEDAPVRVVIPGERAMYWVRHLCRIDFESDSVSARCRKIIMLEAAARLLPSSDYDYYGKTDQVVSVQDLFDTYADVTDDEAKVRLKAADGLEKTETVANLLRGQIKYTGADSPRFVSEELPEGMQVYDLVWIGYGDNLFVSLPLLLEQAGTDQKIFFSDVIRLAGFVNTETYRFTFADGHSATLTPEELADAYLVWDADGQAVLYVESGGEPMAGLLSIEGVTP